MSIWTYAYLFSAPNKKLFAENALESFLTLEMDLDSEYIELHVDTEGHCIEGELQSIVGISPERKFKELLRQEAALQATFRNSEIFISCKFATCGSNPYIDFSWSKKLFSSLSEVSKSKYFQAIKNASKKSGATYVIFIEDVPDYFEDRFIFVDGVPYIDLYLPSGRFHPIEMIWVDRNKGGMLPDGADFDEGHEIGEGFFEYHLQI